MKAIEHSLHEQRGVTRGSEGRWKALREPEKSKGSQNAQSAPWSTRKDSKDIAVESKGVMEGAVGGK